MDKFDTKASGYKQVVIKYYTCYKLSKLNQRSIRKTSY